MEYKYMKRALELARKGKGFVNPNPQVGAVIVKDDEIIGQGYHKAYGENHAEVNAIRSSKSCVGATIYVNLEPCCHFGKTPPCTSAIIDAGIKKVVIAMLDPNPIVAGKGVEILRNHGIEVIVGVLEDEAKLLNEIFINWINKKSPFVIMKTAMTLDGKIASHTGDSKWISNENSRRFVHQIRNRVMGIIVGINTVILDNPSLTTRLEGKSKDPDRIIIDTECRTPLDSKVVNNISKAKTYICVGEGACKERIRKLEDRGCIVLTLEKENGRVSISEVIKYFSEKGFDSLLLEGGGTLNFSFLEKKYVSKIMSFIAPKLIGGVDSKTPISGVGIKKMSDAVSIYDITVQSIDDDILVQGYLERG